jgi:hypothetical protein
VVEVVRGEHRFSFGQLRATPLQPGDVIIYLSDTGRPRP